MKWILAGVALVGVVGVGALVLGGAKKDQPKEQPKKDQAPPDMLTQLQLLGGNIAGMAHQVASDPDTQKNVVNGFQGLLSFGGSLASNLKA